MLAAVPCLADSEFYERRIRPLLAEKCYGCHSAQAKPPRANLRLDSLAGILKGSDTGPVVIPGNRGSRLLKAVSYTEIDLRMPPAGKLSEEQIADLNRWVEMGAPGPVESPVESAPPPAAGLKSGIDMERARKFWAFRPLAKADPSATIDGFLKARLEASGLRFAPPAERRAWLRRITFDLIGLPPSTAEIDAFVNDRGPGADGRVIERLLASPHYGERWARHWLDLVRFSETNGHEFDNDKLDAWRYRDYVIRAFNEDVPYDQFVREQIAGDLLAKPRLLRDGTAQESPVGTSLYWFGEVLNSATDSVKSRADQVDNQIDVISKAFLGLTVACARCHDHKFDPVPALDYYSLAGYMHSTAMREVVIDSPSRQAEIGAAHARIADYNEQIRKLLVSSIATAAKPVPPLRPGDQLFAEFDSFEGWEATGEAFRGGPRREAAPNQPLAGYAGETMASSFGAGTDRLVGSLTSRKFVMPKLWMHFRVAGTRTPKNLKEQAALRITVAADDHKSLHVFPDGTPGFKWVSLRMTKEIGRVSYIEIVDRARDGHIAVDRILFSDSKEPPPDEPPAADTPQSLEALTAGMPENWRNSVADYQARREKIETAFPESSWAMVAADEDPRDVKVHLRGNHKSLGAVAPRRPLQVLTKSVPECQGSGRLGFADWMTGDAAPLVARVMVNRIWQHHFGRGIVSTPDNFGATGDQPSHPQLIEWLAAKFVESGWSVKTIHHLILSSEAYRQSSRVDPAAAKMDPQNRWLHHMPVRRLEGEAIRDAMLAVSGSLDKTMYGPGVTPHVSKYQDGRGKPRSGPLDGGNRRSIYIEVRRNFLTPMFLAFDYPLPVSTIGARSASTTPAQALLMMNNEFVVEMAKRWAQRVESLPDQGRRVDDMFISAFGRPPDAWERAESLALAKSRSWTDLAHVLLNSAEFVYIQ
jgi:hypothetical protein